MRCICHNSSEIQFALFKVELMEPHEGVVMKHHLLKFETDEVWWWECPAPLNKTQTGKSALPGSLGKLGEKEMKKLLGPALASQNPHAM